MAEKYYLRIPVPGGYEYVKVDTSRIVPEILTQLYQKKPNRGGPTQYFPVSSGAYLVAEHPSLQPLKDAVAEVLTSYRSSFESTGEAGKAALEDFLKSIDTDSMFEMISRGEVDSATREWTGILHSLFASTLQLAEELNKKDEHVSGVTAGFEQMASSFDASDAARLKMFDAVIKGSKLLIEAVDGLSQLELRFSEADQKVDTSIDDWNTRLSEDAEPFSSAKSFFESPSSGIGFNLQVFNLMRNPGSAAGNPPDVELARKHLSACKGVIDAVQAEWFTLKSMTGDLNEDRQMASLLCNDLSNGSSAIADFRSFFGAVATLPFDHELFRDRITKEELDRAEGITGDRHWGPVTAKHRFSALVTSIVARIHDAPKPPGAVVRMLEQAARYTDDAEALLSPKTAKRYVESAPESTETAGRSEDDDRIDPRRASELYELVKCVGLVITNNPHFFAGSTVRSMLDVVCHLGLTNPDEAYKYREAVKDISGREGETVRVTDSKRVSTTRKSSKATWVVYTIVKKKGPNLVFMKMTTSGADRIEPLLGRHSLTIESVKEAYKQSREEKEEKRKTRKAS